MKGSVTFADKFWGTDFLSTAGFDTLVRRLTEGRRFCKDMEEYLRQRARIEEDYGQKLLKLSKNNLGNTEIGSVKQSWDKLIFETDKVGQIHIERSKTILDEFLRISKFVEEQKATKKQIEETSKKQHTRKEQNLKRTLDCKKTYFLKCQTYEKIRDEAVAAKLNPNIQAKQIDKLQEKERKAKEEASKADEIYKSQINQLETVRQEWDKEWTNSCNRFQELEEERLTSIKNELTTHVKANIKNMLQNIEHDQEVLDQWDICNVEDDITLFINDKSTGTEHPEPVTYECYYSSVPVARSSFTFPPPSTTKTSVTANTLPKQAMAVPLDRNKSDPSAEVSGRRPPQPLPPPKPVEANTSLLYSIPDNKNSSLTLRESSTYALVEKSNDIYDVVEQTNDLYAVVDKSNKGGRTVKSGEYKVIREYIGDQNLDQLSLKEGDIVHIITALDGTFLEGHVTGRSKVVRGIFPRECLDMDNPVSLI